MIFGKVVCFFKGHKRGRLMPGQDLPGIVGLYRYFSCPRCGNRTRYKVKQP